MTNYLVHPDELVGRAINVEGFRDVYLNEGIDPNVMRDTSRAVAAEWTQDWDEGEGFGSSDLTYMVRHFIQEVLEYSELGHKYQVGFNPTLSVTEYSEAAHDARELEMEIGG